MINYLVFKILKIVKRFTNALQVFFKSKIQNKDRFAPVTFKNIIL
jgi:hypothetical protein